MLSPIGSPDSGMQPLQKLIFLPAPNLLKSLQDWEPIGGSSGPQMCLGQTNMNKGQQGDGQTAERAVTLSKGLSTRQGWVWVLALALASWGPWANGLASGNACLRTCKTEIILDFTLYRVVVRYKQTQVCKGHTEYMLVIIDGHY